MVTLDKQLAHQRLKAIAKGIDQNLENFSDNDMKLLLEALGVVNAFVESKRTFFYKKIIVVSMSQKMSTRTLQEILRKEEIITSEVLFLSRLETIKKYDLEKKIFSSTDILFLLGEVPHSLKGSSDLISLLEKDLPHNVVILRSKNGELKLSKESLKEALNSKK